MNKPSKAASALKPVAAGLLLCALGSTAFDAWANRWEEFKQIRQGNNAPVDDTARNRPIHTTDKTTNGFTVV